MRTRIGWCLLAMGCFDTGRGDPSTSGPSPVAEAAPAEAAPAAAAEAAAEGEGEDDGSERLGKVLESIRSGGYTYARLEACGEEAWVAGPELDLAVGSVVSMPEGLGMENFNAPSLGKTFEAILFVDWFKVVDKEIGCFDPNEAIAKKPGADPHGGGMDQSQERPPPPKVFHGKVVETMSAGGYTYVNIDSCGTSQWLAGPHIPLQVGQFIQSPGGSEMNNFNSPTLNRTFDAIFFVSSIALSKTGPTCG